MSTSRCDIPRGIKISVKVPCNDELRGLMNLNIVDKNFNTIAIVNDDIFQSYNINLIY